MWLIKRSNIVAIQPTTVPYTDGIPPYKGQIKLLCISQSITLTQRAVAMQEELPMPCWLVSKPLTISTPQYQQTIIELCLSALHEQFMHFKAISCRRTICSLSASFLCHNCSVLMDVQHVRPSPTYFSKKLQYLEAHIPKAQQTHWAIKKSFTQTVFSFSNSCFHKQNQVSY